MRFKKALTILLIIIIGLGGGGCMEKNENNKKYTTNQIKIIFSEYIKNKFGEGYRIKEVRPWIEGNTYLEKFYAKVNDEKNENSISFEIVFDLKTKEVLDNAIVFELEKELNGKVKELTKESFGENMTTSALRCMTRVPENQWKGEVDLKEFIQKEKCWIFYCIAVPIEAGESVEKEIILNFSEALVNEELFGKVAIYYLSRENYETVKNNGFLLERLEELRRNGEVQQVVDFKIDENLKILNIDGIKVD